MNMRRNRKFISIYIKNIIINRNCVAWLTYASFNPVFNFLRFKFILITRKLKNNNISIALVSSTSEINLLNLFTKGFKIDPYEMFDLVAHGDCTKIKKPSPEIYEWTLQKLQLPPEACLAIEDSPRGLESSNNARVKTIITPSKLTFGENFKDAKLVISNLGEPDKPFDVISGETYNHSYVSFELLKMISKN